jgi:hypothetical protein
MEQAESHGLGSTTKHADDSLIARKNCLLSEHDDKNINLNYIPGKYVIGRDNERHLDLTLSARTFYKQSFTNLVNL